jgi:amidase
MQSLQLIMGLLFIRLRWPLLMGFCVVILMVQSGCRPLKKEVKKAPISLQRGDNTPRLRALDFTPFEQDLARFRDERAAQIRELVLEADIAEVQKAMNAGDVTSEELTLFFLSRIKHYDEALRSYIELNPLCLEEARAADRLRAQGKAEGDWLGMPVSVKDNIGTAAPLHTTVGAEILLDHSAAKDAAVVTQLRQAGAVILGKASLSELAGCLTTKPAGSNAVSGMGVNPYGRDFPVSGSSSGSAIATSACLTMASVGTETSGSLISPGAMNGVVAMKPSLGLVRAEGVVPLIRFQDSAGPIARCVRDAALLLEVIDNQKVDYMAALDATALEGVAVGVLRADILSEDEPSKQEAWLKLMDAGLQKAKAVSREVNSSFQGKPELVPILFMGLSVDTLGYLRAAGAPVQTVAELQAYNAAKPERRIPRGQNLIQLATQILTAITQKTELDELELGQPYETAALEAREKAAALLAKAFEDHQVEVLVSLGNTHSEVYATAGYPAITVPLGVNAEGAPQGVTFIGKRGEDAKLLACAYAFEQATHYRCAPSATAE